MFTLRRVGDVSSAQTRHASNFTHVLRKAKKLSAQENVKGGGDTTTTTRGSSRGSSSSDPHVASLKKVGRAMIDAVQDDNRPGWRHTYRREGRTKRVRERLETPGALGNEKYRFFAGGHVLEDVTMEGLVERATALKKSQPGAFVEIRRNDIVTNGVVLATERTEDQSDTVTLTTLGEVWAHRSTDIMFSVPDFVPAELTERCGTAAAHSSAHELAARLKVLTRARDFERAVEAQQHRLARFVGELYADVCAAAAPDTWGRLTTLDAARAFDPAPQAPVVTLCAVHKELMAHAAEFECEPLPRAQGMVHRFAVRPRAHLESLRRVRAWLRARDPCVAAFQEKARGVVDAARRLARESKKGEMPARVPEAEGPAVRWTPEDLELIQVLKLSLRLGRKIQRNPYDGIIPAIVKGTKRYQEECGPATAFKFLQEIGVYTPWEDMASKDRELGLTQEPVGEAAGTVASQPIAGLVADAHDSVRHDFGQLPVYVIDDAGAEELDDGVSLERVGGEPGSTWIHVHIADPTAFLPLEHAAARRARALKQNAYFMHRSWAMLPRAVAQRADMGGGGGAGTGTGTGAAQRVLTFSAKVDGEGEIVDYAVRPGVVRNVKVLKYDDVDVVLGERGADHVFRPFDVDGEVEGEEARDVAHVLPFAEELKALHAKTRQLIARRMDTGAFAYTLPQPELTLRPKPVPFNPTDAAHPILYRGFPEMHYTVAGHLAHETGSRSLVAECMKLACRVASRFGVERGVPLVRRALAGVAFASAEAEARALRARDAVGYIDARVALRERLVFAGAATTLAPAAHWGMGVRAGEGYVRATSPLRRFADMVAHWQIKSALLPAGDARRGRAPFGPEALEALAEELEIGEAAGRRAERAHRRYWTHLYVRRWMEEQERVGNMAQWLEGLEGIVTRAVTIDVSKKRPFVEVYITQLGMAALMYVPSTAYARECGETVRVRLSKIEMKDLNPNLLVELA